MRIRSLALACLSLTSFAALAQDAPPPGGGPGAEVREACKADFQSLCKDVQPGGGRIMQCLHEHKDALSAGCKDAIKKAREAHKAAEGAGGQPPPPKQ
jgi:hypothetical protein